MLDHIILTTVTIVTAMFVFSLSETARERRDYWAKHCNPNDDVCFSLCNKSEWRFNYVTNKQEFVEAVSQGKSGLTTRYGEKHGLVRRDGVKVGHVEKIKFKDGSAVDIITRAMKPLLFEIPDFLSSEECDHIIRRAKDPSELGGQMFKSVAKGGLTEIDSFKATGKKGMAKDIFGQFASWDKNKDNHIDMDEITAFLHWRKHIIMSKEDIDEMFKTLEMENVLEDGVIDKSEFPTLNTLGIEEYTDITRRENPRFKHRHSNQAWLHMESWIDDVVHKLRERVLEITGLGREIIYGGERLQVVHYTPFGHYHAHMDSETHERHTIPCCHQKYANESTTVGKCRICRFITFVMYFNDVEEGGETAFPIADDTTGIDLAEMDDILRGNSTTDKVNLSHGCGRSNLLVKPKKGMAVMWYNHYVNETDDWLGKEDKYSIHGGCDVKKGEKWIGNMWLTAPYGPWKEVPSNYLNWFDFYIAEGQAKDLSNFQFVFDEYR